MIQRSQAIKHVPTLAASNKSDAAGFFHDLCSTTRAPAFRAATSPEQVPMRCQDSPQILGRWHRRGFASCMRTWLTSRGMHPGNRPYNLKSQTPSLTYPINSRRRRDRGRRCLQGSDQGISATAVHGEESAGHRAPIPTRHFHAQLKTGTRRRSWRPVHRRLLPGIPASNKRA
jgi:hypothetical protein